MPNQVTLSLNISGTRDFPAQGNGIGPRNFVRTVSAQLIAPELPVYIPATMVDEVVTLPPMPAGMRFLVVCTDNPVSYRINAEPKAADKLIELNGIVILPSTPVVLTITLSGNGTNASQVWMMPCGS
jgi:hypothetical protein